MLVKEAEEGQSLDESDQATNLSKATEDGLWVSRVDIFHVANLEENEFCVFFYDS